MTLQEEDVRIPIVEDESRHYHSNVELNGILTLTPKQRKKLLAYDTQSKRVQYRYDYKRRTKKLLTWHGPPKVLPRLETTT